MNYPTSPSTSTTTRKRKETLSGIGTKEIVAEYSNRFGLKASTVSAHSTSILSFMIAHELMSFGALDTKIETGPQKSQHTCKMEADIVWFRDRLRRGQVSSTPTTQRTLDYMIERRKEHQDHDPISPPTNTPVVEVDGSSRKQPRTPTVQFSVRMFSGRSTADDGVDVPWVDGPTDDMDFRSYQSPVVTLPPWIDLFRQLQNQVLSR